MGPKVGGTHGCYDLTKFRPNRIKNKKILLLGHFLKQTAETLFLLSQFCSKFQKMFV